MKNLGIFVFACALLACKQPVKKPLSKTDLKQIKNDSVAQPIQQDTFDYPVDTIYPAKILTEGAFHHDEVMKKDTQLQWMGIFKNDSGYYLSPLNINITKVKDEIVDDKPGAKTGWEVKTGKKDTSILLIGGLNSLKAGPMISLLKAETVLLTGQTIEFNVKGVTYKLYATGIKKSETHDTSFYSLNQYKIFIEAQINGKVHQQLLLRKSVAEYESTILFVGDIDGDDIPDLVIDAANRENITAPTLYLSRPANKGQLLKVAGMHVTVGC